MRLKTDIFNPVIEAVVIAALASLSFFIFFNTSERNPTQAAASERINFQGKIVNKTSGTNLVTGTPSCVVSGAGNDTCDFRVNIYTDSTGGTLLFREPHTNVEVGSYNGVFNLELNSVCNSWSAPAGSCSGSGITWGSDSTLYIEVEFDPSGNGDFSEGETFTRKLLTSVPYAYYADVAGSVGGFSVDNLVKFHPSSAQSSGNTSNALIWLNEDGSGTPNFLEFEVGGSDKFVVNNDGTLRLYASDGDTGYLTYATNDNFVFAEGSVSINSTNARGALFVSGEEFIDFANGGTTNGAALRFATNSVESFIGSNQYYDQAGSTTVEYARTGGSGYLTFDTSTGATAGDIGFLTAPSGTADTTISFTQRLLIKQDGRVGIGVASPDAWLDILAATSARAQLNLTTSAGTNPSSPVSGDLWWNGTALNFYNGSSTVNLLATGGITSLNGLTAASQTFANDTNVTISSLTSTHTIGWSGQLALGRGGTGANLADPNADRMMFWDDSLGAVTWLAPGTGLSISGTTINNTVSNLFTDGGAVTYLTSQTDDFAIGGTTLVAPFSVDESANTVRIGQGSGSDAILNMFASDGDTGSITYTTTDSWLFDGGSFYHSMVGLPVSEIGGQLTTRHTVNPGDTSNMLGYSFHYQVTNSGITNTANVVPVSITGVLGNSTTFSGGHGTLSGLQVMTGLSTAGTLTNNYSIHVRPSFTAGTVTNSQGLRIDSTIGGGTITNNYGIFVQDQTVGSSDYGLYIEGADTYAIWVDNDDVRLDNDLIVGGNTSSTETLANASFTLGGDDLFVAGQIGAESDIFTDAGIVVGNSALTAGGTIEYDGTDVFAYRSDKAISLTEGFLYDKHRQEISTDNTVADQLVRKGWGYSQGTLSGTSTVSFGITFEEVPIMSFDKVGSTASAPIKLNDCTGDASWSMELSGITTSNFDYYRNVGSTTTYYCYAWIAIGEYTTGYGADLAETYLTRDLDLKPGQVVAIDENNDIAVRKSSGAYDSKAFGIVSTAPGQVLGNKDATSADFGTAASIKSKAENQKLIEQGRAKVLLVALEGRVPVKVSLENGDIKKGDYLTPASKPGYAMKATKPGNIIGRALEDFNERSSSIIQPGDSEYDAIMAAQAAGDTKKVSELIKAGNNGEGQIMVLVEKGQQLGEGKDSLIKVTGQLVQKQNWTLSLATLIALTLLALNLEQRYQLKNLKLRIK